MSVADGGDPEGGAAVGAGELGADGLHACLPDVESPSLCERRWGSGIGNRSFPAVFPQMPLRL
jgi:hypothetical protein